MKKTLTALGLASLVLVGTPPATATATAPAKSEPLRILLTNDDGYTAPGIKAVYDKLTAAGNDVTIVAPTENQSGTGTGQAFGGTVKASHVSEDVWAVTGTPGDSVMFGLFHVFKDKKPDLVVSGTNFGQNIAALANHSGTLGGAVSALDHDIPAIAVSTEFSPDGSPEATLNAQRHTAAFLAELIASLRAKAGRGALLPEDVGLNVNYPIVGPDGDRPATDWALTNQDRQPILVPSYTDKGDGTYAIGISYAPREPGPRADLVALAADKISITPIDANWTAGAIAYGRAGSLLRGLKP
ncbi:MULTISPECIES: 5'/3'-nucleotidase SurE [Thermomonosporaceae]|uniref:5'/3'-nucleotidase SurE n=1 Tax=Thermomonosporaceae TaxID=2012 RepID=UPI00255B0C62|nr:MULTISPECIES: 5'/3'-nucleotidase SurE [Thermomonosporaceae]MDL4775239.1 5'/3'-nucleotidase SurE [Actinomadura xylanilytica]